MKECLTTILWMVVWMAFLMSVPSCINLPPPAPMGDGAVRQIGLINWFQDNKQTESLKPKPVTTVKVTDNAIEIRVPKK